MPHPCYKRQDPYSQGAHGLVTVIQRNAPGIVLAQMQYGAMTTIWILTRAMVD